MNRATDQHVTTRELITLQDQMEENIYFGSQFDLDGMGWGLTENLICSRPVKLLMKGVRTECGEETFAHSNVCGVIFDSFLSLCSCSYTGERWGLWC